MASGYLYRSGLVERVRQGLEEAPVVVWGPPGFGKTLLLKEVARAEGLPYRTEPGEGPGAYDLAAPPPGLAPGQLVALPARPAEPDGAVLVGPEALAFGEAEVAELARRVGAPRLAREAVRSLGGWPLLVRRGLEAGRVNPAAEPLRGYLEAWLARLDALAEALWALTLPLPEAAWRRAGAGAAIDALLAGGWLVPGERLGVRTAAARYLAATRGRPPWGAVAGAVAAAVELDPEAALEAYLAYRREEAGPAFERVAEALLASAAYEKAVRLWRRLPKEARTPRGALLVARAERSLGRLEAALALARRATSDPGVFVEARDVEGSVLILLGRYREAARAFSLALERAPEDRRHRLLAGLGAALIRDGRYRQAAGVLERAVAAAKSGEDPLVLARAQHNLGIARHHAGYLEEAVAAYREALALKGAMGPLTQANTLLSMGEALRLLGRFEEAHRVLKEALEKAEASREYRAVGYSALNLGDLYADAGWWERAEAAYLRAEAALHPTGDRYGEGLLALGRARVRRGQGAPASALRLLEAAEAALKEGGSPAELAEVYLERARLCPDRAPALLAEAEAMAAEAGSRRLLARIRAERVLLGTAGDEAALYAAGYALEEDLPLLLDLRYLPVWARAAEAGPAGRALLEELALGRGTTRVRSLGGVRIEREGPLGFPTSKEPWVLLFLWLRPGDDPRGLFAAAKNPDKRLQIAVHHLRRVLGEDWVERTAGGYRARPLPGVWWDAAVFRAAARARQPRLVELARRVYQGPLAPGAPFEKERNEYEKLYRELAG